MSRRRENKKQNNIGGAFLFGHPAHFKNCEPAINDSEPTHLSKKIYEFSPSEYGWIERNERLDVEIGRALGIPLTLRPGWKDKAEMCV